MARYLSIEEVASALGTTDRTVRRMLNDGRLPGSQTKEKGKMVWRVHATKELLEKLEKLYGTTTVNVDTFEVEDNEIGDSETTDTVSEQYQAQDSATSRSAWHGEELSKLKVVAEELSKALLQPMSEKLEAQARIIVEQEKEIEDLNRQVRLLPDLQKQAEKTEESLKLKHSENDALLKQIDALKQIIESDKEKLAESEALKKQLSELSSKVSELQQPWWKKVFGAKSESKAT